MNKTSVLLRPIKLRDVLKIWAIWLGTIAALVAVLLLASFKNGLSDYLQWILTLLASLAGIVGLWLVFLRRGWTWRDLGFIRMSSRGWHLLWQIPVAIFVSLIATALLAGAVLGLSPAESSSETAVASEVGNVAVLVTLVSYLVFGPLLEEIMLRRFTMSWFDRVLARVTKRRWVTVSISTIASSLIFAVLHVVPPVMVWTFFLGVGCAILSRWHRSLWAGFLLHLVVNAVASSALVTALFQ